MQKTPDQEEVSWPVAIKYDAYKGPLKENKSANFRSWESNGVGAGLTRPMMKKICNEGIHEMVLEECPRSRLFS